jgi:putative ABC transport system permease protein
VPSIESLIQDLRFAVRMLSKSPGFTAAAVLILALGIGANSAVFGLVNAVLLRPLNGGNVRGEFVGLYSADRTRPDRYRPFSYPEYADIRRENDVFESLIAEAAINPGLTEAGVTRRVRASVVSSNYFSTLGVALAAGRAFTPDEERPDSAAAVAIVSYPYWLQHGLTRDVLGRSITVNGHPLTVVGVAPPRFNGTMPVMSADLWLPFGAGALVTAGQDVIGYGRFVNDRSVQTLLLGGTLRRGTSAAAAESRLAALASSFEAAFPESSTSQRFVVRPRSRVSIGPGPRSDAAPRAGAVVLMSLAGLVLFVTCLNLANILLARGAVRRQEIAIRLALGGGRPRIVRQLLIEGLLLSMLGGITALLTAWWATSRVLSSLTSVITSPIVIDVSPDSRVLTIVALSSIVSTLLFALGPAWTLSRPDLSTALKQSAPLAASRKRRVGMPALMVATQVALSVALLISAGAFVRASVNAASSDPGFPLAGGILAQIDPQLAGFDRAQSRAMYTAVLDRLRSLPNVETASLASIVPLGDVRDGRQVQYGNDTMFSMFNVIGAGYFSAVRLPVVAGREFTALEEREASAEPIAIVDLALTRRLFPGTNALGQSIRLSGFSQPEELVRIVGIVGDVRDDVLQPLTGHVYVPFGSHFRSEMTLHVRTAAGTEARMLEPVRAAIESVDPRLPILSVKTLTNHRDGTTSLWTVTLAARLFVMFGLIAGVLATAGVYGLRAYLMTQRKREIGIRVALGGTRAQILGEILREGSWMAATGLIVGTVLAVAFIQVLRQSELLYQVDAFDPLVFTVAPLVLASATAAASYIPARRAIRVDPTVALRPE